MENKIFIVDDDPFWTNYLKKALKTLGYSNIHLYSNGRDCIADLCRNPSLIFLDYQMDNMDGLEVLQEIKNYYSGIGVVFCSANEDLKVIEQAKINGSYEYIFKSNLNSKELAHIIENAIRFYELDGQTF